MLSASWREVIIELLCIAMNWVRQKRHEKTFTLWIYYLAVKKWVLAGVCDAEKQTNKHKNI
jgi:hypothetical protein